MQIPDVVPAAFARTIVDLYAADGVAWLERLPITIADYARRWSFVVAPAFPNLSYNYVAPAVRASASPKTWGCRRTSFSWTPSATSSNPP